MNAQRPRRRPGLAVAQDGQRFVLYDARHVGGPPQTLDMWELEATNFLTGQYTLQEIQIHLMQKFNGIRITREGLDQLVARLDQSLFLDSPQFLDYLRGPLRRPACIGCYPEEPDDIHTLMDSLFQNEGGPGLPSPKATRFEKRLRAILVPHMDYARGDVTYGWGFKTLAEQTDARLFVIIATSHYSPARFTLTRMNFQTPLGTVATDQAYIDRISSHYGPGLFDDVYAHLPEHSIELEVVPLQHLYPGDGAFRIVPLLVGSFRDCVSSHTVPNRVAEIARMAAALRKAEAEAGEPVCYIISGDLAHIGPKFEDPQPVHEAQLKESRGQDDLLLAALQAADSEKYFRVIAEEGDCRRICGLPPTYLAMETIQPRTGDSLHYGRYVHPQGHESVSFAAAAFYS